MVLFLLSLSIHQYQDSIYRPFAEFGRPAPFHVLLEQRKGLQKTYYGYLPYWVGTSTYGNFRYQLLTHIAYFSVSIDPSTGVTGAIPNLSNFTSIVNQVHPRGVKVDMRFTIFGSTNVSTFLNNASARLTAIDSIVSLISAYGIDGANIDFEFVTPSVKDFFSRFINDLYYELINHPDGRKELYIAMPAVPSWHPGYDYAYLSAHSDGLFIMGYDYHYNGSSTAGPVAPTVNSSFWGYYAINTTIGDYIDYGAEREKMILGMPYYGIDWPTETSEFGSTTRGNGDVVIFKNAVSNASSYGRLWDTYSLTPWYNYYVSEDGWHQCWYDDSVSIGLKIDIVNDSMLQGAGCWALGYDDGYDDLWNIIESKLWYEPHEHHYVVEVVAGGLNIRDGPSTSYPVLSYGSQGQKFVAFMRQGNWYKVYFPSASGPYYGWMYGGDGTSVQYLKGSTGDTIARITASLLNVREGPSTSYNVITQFAFGQCFVVDSIDGGWSRVYLPNIDGNTYGWCYTASYANMHENPEDYNLYNGFVNGVYYRDTVYSGDTFTVSIHTYNAGYGPFDSLVLCVTGSPSPFFDSLTWIDSTSVPTGGYDGLPGQTFYRNFICRAPVVSDTTYFSETFNFSRRGNLFGENINIGVVVIPSPLYINRDTVIVPEGRFIFRVSRNVFTAYTTFYANTKGRFTFRVFDATGRRVVSNEGSRKLFLRFGDDHPAGIYFYVFSAGSKIKRGKVIKVR